MRGTPGTAWEVVGVGVEAGVEAGVVAVVEEGGLPKEGEETHLVEGLGTV